MSSFTSYEALAESFCPTTILSSFFYQAHDHLIQAYSLL